MFLQAYSIHNLFEVVMLGLSRMCHHTQNSQKPARLEEYSIVHGGCQGCSCFGTHQARWCFSYKSYIVWTHLGSFEIETRPLTRSCIVFCTKSTESNLASSEGRSSASGGGCWDRKTDLTANDEKRVPVCIFRGGHKTLFLRSPRDAPLSRHTPSPASQS